MNTLLLPILQHGTDSISKLNVCFKQTRHTCIYLYIFTLNRNQTVRKQKLKAECRQNGIKGIMYTFSIFCNFLHARQEIN